MRGGRGGHPADLGGGVEVVGHGGHGTGVGVSSEATQPRVGVPARATACQHGGSGTAMTETAERQAARATANQAGARVNKDAYAQAADFLPLKGIDHVEFWVGNARQASAYYRALWGFGPVAFSGLETKVRDRASYVMVQNGIRFVFTAPADPRRRDRRARPAARRRRPRHRLRRRRRRERLARDDGPRRDRRPAPDRARRRRGRRPAQGPRSGPTARPSTRSSTGTTTTASSRRAIGPSSGRPGRRAG